MKRKEKARLRGYNLFVVKTPRSKDDQKMGGRNTWEQFGGEEARIRTHTVRAGKEPPAPGLSQGILLATSTKTCRVGLAKAESLTVLPHEGRQTPKQQKEAILARSRSRARDFRFNSNTLLRCSAKTAESLDGTLRREESGEMLPACPNRGVAQGNQVFP